MANNKVKENNGSTISNNNEAAASVDGEVKVEEPEPEPSPKSPTEPNGEMVESGGDVADKEDVNGTKESGGGDEAEAVAETEAVAEADAETNNKQVDAESTAKEEDPGTQGEQTSANDSPSTPATPIIEEPGQSGASISTLRVPSVNSNANQSTRPAARKASISSAMSTGAFVDNGNIFSKAFEQILDTKEAKKNEALKAAVTKALDSIKDSNSRDSDLIFAALKMTCTTSNNSLKSKAIDLFAKLFDYGQFEDEQDKVKLTDNSVNVISGCFDGEGTDPDVELQVVRALMHSILLMPCHGATLLKAVRLIYNVFIFSLNARNQAVAQGILTQAIGAVFQRVHEVNFTKGSKGSQSSPTKASMNISKEDFGDDVDDTTAHEKLTLENLEKLNDETYDNFRVNEANNASDKDEDLAVKDAFLIFRAMCKLSVKEVETETLDMRSHSVRSKLLSLHIVHTILKQNIDIFLSHDVVLLSNNSNETTRLINAVRQYLCLTLSRNAASSIAPVFELSLELFWLIISTLRSEFKREIPLFWDEIYFPVSEMKTSTPHQKRYLLSIIERLCNDSRCIIEFYLNYDCDSSMPNICERIIDYLTRLSLVRVEVTSQQRIAFQENKRNGVSVYDTSKTANLTSNTMTSRPPEPEVYNHFPLEYALKMVSINCSVAFLRSLYTWAQKGISPSTNGNNNLYNSASHLSLSRDRSNTANSDSLSNIDLKNPSNNGSRNTSMVHANDVTGNETDDPEQFENLKQRKKVFLEGIRQFNQKAKKGIKYFIENEFIKSGNPKDIAEFLMTTDGLDKAVIGEYLGEADETNVAVMHAFVDQMEFNNTHFVDAMRTFLQAFRLPGEAQKIDRFMLKFAERYLKGNPDLFANADTAYILSYSVILLNTDLHSPQVKNRMTLENFLLNNSGIDDGKDLPKDYLETIYNEILNNEIKLQSEQHAALLAGEISLPQSSQSVGFFGGRDPNREAYYQASREMSTKTEKLVRDLGKKLRSDSSGGVFYAASSVYHVKSIFDTLWMSVLAGLTPPFKEYDDSDVHKICLEGIKLSIKIACMFDLDYARKSFIGALAQFQNLHNYEEMKPKNVDAIYIMLELAITEGNYLRSSWIQLLTSISQLERLQLIAQGIDQDSIPDVSAAKLVNRNSTDSPTRASSSFFSLFTSVSNTSASQSASNKYHNQQLNANVAALLTKTELEVAIDKVFTNSANLSGDSIVEFTKALTAVSLEEIESSGQSTNPRIFSLQKIVDICYYNMKRIRVEWSHLWSTMGETFNTVGTHSNIHVLFFALDSLRQLSVRFFEIEELSHFKFQKEFLKPFEYIIHNNQSFEIKDMVLECINNMILAKSGKIKSGWRSIFGVLTAGAKEKKESIVNKTFKMASSINKGHFEEIKAQDAFGDLILCFTALCKNGNFQKINLLSLEVLERLTNQIAITYFNEKEGKTELLNKLWFPILFGLHDVIMVGEELEVRSRALSHLFDILLEYGENFEVSFWNRICKELLFPIFSVLRNHWELSNIEDTNDNFSVWLSTTLIQALRNMIGLFTHYIDSLRVRLGDYLELLINCICQQNDTIARIGRSCLHSLLIDNASQFNDEEWKLITQSFSRLFDLTVAKELFEFDPLHEENSYDEISNNTSAMGIQAENDDVGYKKSNDDGEQTNETIFDSQIRKSKEKSNIVVKCVLQLLMIETVSELFDNDNFYESVPFKYLDQMAKLLESSYKFAKSFNDDYDLRVRLWNAGIIERLPNLLKQESSASAVYINIMFRMYCDDDKINDDIKQNIVDVIIPLCNTIIEGFSEFDETNQQRNISTWKPVIVEIYQGYTELDDGDFIKFSKLMYYTTLKLLGKNLSLELRLAIKSFLSRIGDTYITK